MLSHLRFILHGRSDLAVEGVLDARAPALLTPLATVSGAEILCTLPLAERFLKDPEAFAQRQGRPRS